ncbi:MAG: hypothetical protein J6328_01610, partial [Bacilli bacterium]|nr:hypothetical protein [Bacilli bacterium]
MGLNKQSNNRNWGKKANIAAAREFAAFGEINDFPSSGAASNEFPSNDFSPYEDSDIGSSLQEVKDEGNMALAESKRIKAIGMASAIAVSSLGAIVIINNIAQSKPVVESAFSEAIVVEDVGEYKLLTYDFMVTYKAKATLFLSLRLGERTHEGSYALRWADDDPEVKNKGLAKQMRFANLDGGDEDSPYRLDETYRGEYEFRIYCQFGFGKSSLLSCQGKI